MKQLLQWEFGGLLEGVPALVAWVILTAAGVGGATFIVFSYHRTLLELSPFRRRVLTGLRLTLLFTILFCLANPSRVLPFPNEKKNSRKLAVVVDRSASMSTMDSRSETRLGNALRQWKRHEEEAERAFDSIDHYQFSTNLKEMPSLEAAASTGKDGPETHLYAALRDVIKAKVAGIVCLTDGLDTTGENTQSLVAAAQSNGVPLYFVAGCNRSRASEFQNIEEVRIPSRVLRQSKFIASAVLEISASRDCETPVELWRDGKKLAGTTLKVRAGWNVLPWKVEIAAGEPGPMPLEFRLGSGSSLQIAASTTQVMARNAVEILYYEGAVQWGHGILLSALQSDPSFKVTSLLNPALRLQMAAAASDATALTDLPEAASELKRFQIVILAHVYADQLTVKQQEALVDYAHDGGGILFITSDNEATQRFAGTTLEQMLPVAFEPPIPQRNEDSVQRDFEKHMREIGGDDANADTIFTSRTKREQMMPELLPFRVSGTANNPLTAPVGQDVPMFSSYARIRSVKSGAQILAVHPRDLEADGKTPRVLMARQQFGNGFTVTMATDMLWRWKLSLSSTSRTVEAFWQQLMLALVPAPEHGLSVANLSGPATVNQALTIRVNGASGSVEPKIIAVSPAGVQKILASEMKDNGWLASFQPDSVGRWDVLATDAEQNRARITLSVSPQARSPELMNLPTDVDGLRRIAEATGGALVEDRTIFERTAPIASSPAVRHVEPLWNTRWFIALLLGMYGTELIARRLFRLL